jgi:hypothetical protein
MCTPNFSEPFQNFVLTAVCVKCERVKLGDRLEELVTPTQNRDKEVG